MSDVYQPPERVASESHCRGMEKYQEMYNESIDDPSKFWRRICQQFYWKKQPSEGETSPGLLYNDHVCRSYGVHEVQL